MYRTHIHIANHERISAASQGGWTWTWTWMNVDECG